MQHWLPRGTGRGLWRSPQRAPQTALQWASQGPLPRRPARGPKANMHPAFTGGAPGHPWHLESLQEKQAKTCHTQMQTQGGEAAALCAIMATDATVSKICLTLLVFTPTLLPPLHLFGGTFLSGIFSGGHPRSTRAPGTSSAAHRGRQSSRRPRNPTILCASAPSVSSFPDAARDTLLSSVSGKGGGIQSPAVTAAAVMTSIDALVDACVGREDDDGWDWKGIRLRLHTLSSTTALTRARRLWRSCLGLRET